MVLWGHIQGRIRGPGLVSVVTRTDGDESIAEILARNSLHDYSSRRFGTNNEGERSCS